MLKHILTMELRRSLKSFLIWTLSMGVMMFSIALLWPLLEDMYEELFTMLPESMLELFGGGLPPENVVEYIAAEGAMMLHIFGAIFAAMLGFGIANREINEMSVDCMYTLPITRTTIYLTKLISVLIQVVLFSFGVFVFVLLGILIIGDVPNLGGFVAFMAMNTVMLIFIAFIGFALAMIIKKNFKPITALIIPFPLYIIYLISQLSQDNEALKSLRHVSPFTFAEPFIYIRNLDFEWISIVVYSGLTIFLLVIGLLRFKTKEFLS